MLKETVKVSQYWGLEHDVSRGFNILKAKLFNLIEATIKEEQPQLATKSLIRDFANDAFKIVIQEMRRDAVYAGLLKSEEIDVPESSYPLENGDR